jgi:hypothetical protein
MMEPVAETDEACLAAFERGDLAWAQWTHRMHLRMARLILKRDGFELGLSRLREGIQRYNSANGRPTSYHETMTVAWARLVHHAMEKGGAEENSVAFLEAHPELTESNALLRYFRPETLGSASARAVWIEPDLAPLPDRAANRSSER